MLVEAAETGQVPRLRLLLLADGEFDYKDRDGYTALHGSSMHGYLDCVKLLVEHGADINARCNKRCTALYYASERGYYLIAKFLIEKRAKVDILGGLQGTALHVASAKGKKAIIKLLLDNGANVEVENSGGKTALALADEGGHQAIVRVLRDRVVKAKAENRRRRTARSSQSSVSIEAVQLLSLQRSASLEPPLDTPSSSTSIESSTNSNPLFVNNRPSPSSSASAITSYKREHSTIYVFKAKLKCPRLRFVAAAEGGDIPMLRKLLDDREQRSQLKQITFNKALIAVSSNGKRKRKQTEAVETLLREGAALEYKDDGQSRTPLIWAVIVGREDIIDVLLNQKALIEERDGVWGWTPLIWAISSAISSGSEAIIKKLIARDASLAATDEKWKRTPLLWAAMAGAHTVVEILLQKNPELIDVGDKEKRTALALAYRVRHDATARVLIRYGANRNIEVEPGLPLLIAAVKRVRDELFVHLLLDDEALLQAADSQNRRALLEARDSHGRTALLWAVGLRRRGLVELLVQHGADRSAADNNERTVREWAEETKDPTIIKLVSENG